MDQIAQNIEVEIGPARANVDTGYWIVDAGLTIIFIAAFVWLLSSFRKPPQQ